MKNYSHIFIGTTLIKIIFKFSIQNIFHDDLTLKNIESHVDKNKISFYDIKIILSTRQISVSLEREYI